MRYSAMVFRVGVVRLTSHNNNNNKTKKRNAQRWKGAGEEQTSQTANDGALIPEKSIFLPLVLGGMEVKVTSPGLFIIFRGILPFRLVNRLMGGGDLCECIA